MSHEELDKAIRQILSDTYLDSQLEPTDNDVDIAVKDIIELVEGEVKNALAFCMNKE